MQIPSHEIRIEPTSGLDDTGKVFRWKNEVYRGIYSPYAEFYRKLFSGFLGDDLVNIGLIPTEIVPYQVDEFDLILKHERIPVLSYASEWCSSMLKDAALLTCDIQLRLLESGYTLKDAHPWNVLFDACTPKFVDIGSISEKSLNRINFFLKDFRSTFLYPLLLKYGDFSRLVNAIFIADLGIEHKLNIYRMLFRRIPLRALFYHRQQDQKVNRIWNESPSTGTKLLREQIEKIPLFPKNSKSVSCVKNAQSIKSEPDSPLKIQILNELLDELRPKSVLDVYAVNSSYLQLAESKGTRVIAAHTNELRLNEIYHRSKAKDLNILPIRLDLFNPTLAHGPWGMCKDSTERLKSDLVIMLNFAPQIVKNYCQPLENIAFYLFSFTKNWTLVDFISQNDKHSGHRDTRRSAKYDLNRFLTAFNQQFQKVSIYRQIAHNRWLVLCAKR
jgi:hypothetical protein